MKYNWDDFTKEDYEKTIKAAKEMETSGYDDYFGRVRCGQLCIEVMVYYFGGRKNTIFVDGYVPYREGYGYKTLEDETEIPYDMFEVFETNNLDLTYEEFKELFEKETNKIIENANLTKEANAELFIW